jgi:hypothetical protein
MMNRAVWIASRRLVRAPTVASRCLGTQIYDSGSVTVSNLLKKLHLSWRESEHLSMA